MKLQFWLKVQSQWNPLLQNLNVLLVCDGLMSKQVLTFDDYERIKHEVTMADKSRKLLEILKHKNDEHFENFVNVLRDSKEYNAIVEAIMVYKVPDGIHEELGNTTKESEKIIKQCLEESFEKAAVGKASWTDIMDKVRHSFRAQGECFEHDETMIRIVQIVLKDVFPSSNMEASPRKATDICVSGIQKKEIQEKVDRDMTSTLGGAEEQAQKGAKFGSDRLDAQSVQSKTPQELSMSDMTEHQLCNWLTPVLKENNIKDVEKFLHTITDEEINGKVFENMTTEEMERHFPDIKFGKLKLILLHRDKYLEKIKTKEGITHAALMPEPELVINNYREVFREFNMTSKAVNIYRHGAVMPEVETRVVDRIQPVHRFIQTEASISEEDQIKVIIDAVIEFAAACINEKTNGTIHFGISGNANDQKMYGTVIGLPAKNPQKYDEKLVKTIESKFYPDQKDKALACIRPPQFIPVLQRQQKEELFVIEVDIVPNFHIVGHEAFFIKDQDQAILYRYLDNAPKKLNPKEVEVYMKDKIILSDDRRNGEITLHRGPKNIRRELQGFLCNGSEQMDGDIYPLIFLSPPGTAEGIEDLQFLNYLDPSAVFDFDPKGTDGQIYRVQEKQYIVKTIDDFDAKFVEQKSIQENFNDLKKPLNQPWFFCNGHESAGQKEMESFEWTQERSESFKKILSFYQEQIPQDRAKIIFVIHSENFKVLGEAAREVVLKFKGKWIMLSESEHVAESWKAFLLSHYDTCFEKQTLDERCFAGMPWNTVRDTIKDFVHTELNGQCEIPTLHGGFVEVPGELKKELCDLEILSARECANQEAMVDDSDDHKKKVEEDFYKGYQVSWWNFWYSGQVLKRNEQNNILKHILEVSKGDLPHYDKVGCVAIYHQPGSGGTTTARQALWDNRQSYPCLVAKQITNLTCSQICKIRSFPGEKNIQVPVILIDNEDDEKLFSLKESLEEEAKQCTQRVFCILLVCYRRTILPFEKIQKYISLIQKLDKQEQNWFQQKYKELIKRYEQKKGVDPNHLISFNIMKEDFSSECISRTVKEFLCGLNANEFRLLKYVALVNAYDPNFSPIPVSCFDPIMTRREYVPSKNHCHRTIGLGWEQNLGPALLVLLSRIEQERIGKKAKSLRVTNPLLSKEIMNQIISNDGQTLGEAFLEFLNTFTPILQSSNTPSNILLKILQTMMKKREWKWHEKEAQLQFFSPLLQTLIDEGDSLHAIEILKSVFEFTKDPMIAQQFARLYNHLEAWEQADYYAEIACTLRPNDSFLKHTQGQICKSKLLKIYKDHADKIVQLDQQTAIKAIEHGMKAFFIFQEVQQLYYPDQSSQNLSGHTGQIETCILLLDTLSLLECFQKHPQTFHQYLVQKDFQTGHTKFIEPPKANFLKSLVESVFNTLDAFESQLYLMKKNVIPEQKRALALQHRGVNDKYRIALNTYFGDDVTPEGLNPLVKSEYNRRIVQAKCGRSFYRISSLQLQEDGNDLLQLALEFMQENIQFGHHNNQDLVVVLSAALALNCGKNKQPSLTHNVKFVETLTWSRQLFDRRSDDHRIKQEACMLLLIFHWPTPSKLKHSLCPQSLLKKALEDLRSISKQNRRWDRIQYYLSNGGNFDSIVHAKDVRGDKKRNGTKRIETSRLLWLQGTLTNNGHEITTSLENSEGVKGLSVTLTTMKPIPDSKLWNKPVFFVVGFCLSGPKALEVTNKDPRSTAPVKFTIPNNLRRTPVTADFVCSTKIFENEICRFTKELKKIQDIENRQSLGIRLSQEEKKLLSRKVQVEEHFHILKEQRFRFLQGYY